MEAMPLHTWEGAIDFPNIAIHKLILISKYGDNSILRDEELENSGVAEAFMLIRDLTYNLSQATS